MKKNKEKLSENGKGKTIEREIKKIMILLLSLSLGAIGIITCISNYVSTMNAMRDSMANTAVVAADQINYRLKSTLNLVEMLGSVSEFSSDETSTEEKQQRLEAYRQNYEWKTADIVNTNGISIFNEETDVSADEFFQKALQGSTVMSDPIYNEETKELEIIIAAPLWLNGQQNTEVGGVVMVSADAQELSDVATSIKVSTNASSYIINGEGTVIAHEDFKKVTEGTNVINEAKTNSSKKTLAKQEEKMVQGEAGFGSYYRGATCYYMGYAPIGLNGWSLATTAPASDFLGGTIISILVTIVLMGIALFAGIHLSRKISKQIGDTVSVCANRLKLLAQGDLETKIPDITAEDETKILADSTQEIVDAQRAIIHDISYILAEMAGGNFDVHSQIGEDAYMGGYGAIMVAMRDLKVQISETLETIVQSAKLVDSGSMQLAEGASELADGATNQAAAVEELLATVTDVTRQVEETTKATDEAHDKAKVVGIEAMDSQAKMTQLTEAMVRIESTSNEIKKVIAGIEDIASQTNLLSLNASIEAARAGEAGKGFAVVADQIGKLAEQSAKAAVNTRQMIETCIAEVENGSNITGETQDALTKVLDGLEAIVQTIANVREASDKQELAVEQIEQGVEQISSVVESNSASAQQSSATSEELSAQAQNLNMLVSKFTLTK